MDVKEHITPRDQSDFWTEFHSILRDIATPEALPIEDTFNDEELYGEPEEKIDPQTGFVNE